MAEHGRIGPCGRGAARPLDSTGPLVYDEPMRKVGGLVVSVWLAACSVSCLASEDPDALSAEGDPALDAPVDVAAAPPDAEVTASGLASRQLVAGTGTRRPSAADNVRVHYTGWQTDGNRFDTSRDGAPAEFGLDMVIRGWTEGLQLMVEGESRRFWIPEDLAYRGAPNRPSGVLVFDVELIAIID